MKKTIPFRLAMTTRVYTDTIPDTKLLIQIGHVKNFCTMSTLVVGCLIMDDTIVGPYILDFSLPLQFETPVEN